MNEWSPGGNYSRPGTPSQTGRSFRSQWDESEKGTKPLIVNARAVPENKTRSFQQLSVEDVSKNFPAANRIKKGGTGASDPRFKRVIPSGAQNDACIGTELKGSKLPTLVPPGKETFKSKTASWDPTDFKPNKSVNNTTDNIETAKSCIHTCELPESDNMLAPESFIFDPSQDHLKEVDKLSFSHDITLKSFSKESVSDCTVNTRNTSLISEDLVDEFPNDLSACPSATRVKKVQNWIQDQKVKPEKKQSVITVIGQTQGQDNLCSGLREVDKRKQLVKELDKYEVCKKAVDADKDKEISELVAKINFLSKVGRIMFSHNKTEEKNEVANVDTLKGGSEKLEKHLDSTESSHIDKILSMSNDACLDPTLQTLLSKKRSSSKKKSKKIQPECPIKGRLQQIISRVQYQWVFFIMVSLSCVLFLFAFSTLHHGVYITFDLFSQKPKPLTLYEKICMWIWEIFRPSNNYRRMAPWHPY